MAALIEFFKVGDYSFCSDRRDVRTSDKYIDIKNWCNTNRIIASGVMIGTQLPYNVWRIEDEEQRSWFRLRWEE